MINATMTTEHNQPCDGNDDDHNNRNCDHGNGTITELEPGLRNHTIPECAGVRNHTIPELEPRLRNHTTPECAGVRNHTIPELESGSRNHTIPKCAGTGILFNDPALS